MVCVVVKNVIFKNCEFLHFWLWWAGMLTIQKKNRHTVYGVSAFLLDSTEYALCCAIFYILYIDLSIYFFSQPERRFAVRWVGMPTLQKTAKKKSHCVAAVGTSYQGEILRINQKIV